MTPTAILSELWAADIDLQLADDGVNLVATGTPLTPAQRHAIVQNKPALVQFLTEAQATTTALIEAASRACDHHGDGEAARQQMRDDCLAVPVHLRADLLEHFSQNYPKAKP
jgi:hypothetical protein